MSNPFTEPGCNFNRYLLSTAAAVVFMLMALVPPLASLAGAFGPGPLVGAGYGVIALAAVVEVLRNGATLLRTESARRTCLQGLQGLLWGVAGLSLPALVLDITWRSGWGAWAGPAEERRVFATVSLVFAVLAVAAALNLAAFLRSRLWAAFRTFALQEGGARRRV